MSEEKQLTEAEKQILRLEQLRLQKEQESKQSAEKTFFHQKTQVQRTTDRLTAMKKKAAQTPGQKRTRFEGKRKSAKLTLLQLKALEEIHSRDPRLVASQLMRIALNHLLEIENSAEENELEAKALDVLRRLKSRS
jgi:hypothetical protein